jgi:ATP-dependent DNA ligase
VSRKWSPLLSAKVFTKKEEDTKKHLDLLEGHINKGPVYTSIKWDGWRMFEYGGRALCRSMDPPKNLHVQKTLAEMFADIKARTKLTGLDGEAIGGTDPYARNAMQRSTTAFGRINDVSEFQFMAFDSYQYATEPFTDRFKRVQDAVSAVQSSWPFLQLTQHSLIDSMPALMANLDYVEKGLGAEGVMGRDPKGQYKLGRSTMKDGILWALKPYADGECRILSIHEMMENTNPQTLDSRGYSKRSGHKEGMVGKGTFGYAVCEGIDPIWPQTFHIGMGPGLNDELRAYIWAHPEEFVGGVMKYKYQAIGCVERPRQPKWMGMRPKEDLGPTK